MNPFEPDPSGDVTRLPAAESGGGATGDVAFTDTSGALSIESENFNFTTAGELSIAGEFASFIGTTPTNDSFGFLAEDGLIQMFLRLAGATMTDLRPTAGASETPYTFNTSLNHTSGNLYEFKNNGTEKASLDFSGKLTLAGSVQTAAPAGGTAAAWKLGVKVDNTVELDTAKYLQVDIGGTLYKIALVTES